MEKILLVENNRTVAKMVLLKFKQKINADVVWVKSFAEARSEIEKDKQKIFAVISGLVLPDAVNGEFVDYALDQGLAVIILTSTLSAEVREKWNQRPIFDYVIIESPDYIGSLIESVQRTDLNRFIKVLVVDDSKVERGLHRKLLEKQRLQVLEAENGKDALAMLNQHKDIRLILTDYHMPEMDGLELLKQIRKGFSSTQLAVMVVSGEEDDKLIPLFLKMGANDFIKKPFYSEEFLARIRINLQNLELIEEIQGLSYIDLVTGLYNNKYLEDVGKILFAMALRGQTSLIVSMVGIDDYEYMRDLYGQRVMNALVRQLGKTFDQNLKRQSDVVARYDEDRFVILSDNLDESQLTSFFERLIELIREHPFKVGKESVNVSLSMGVCLHTRPTFQEMIDDAAQLLEEARFEGTGKLFFE